MKRRVMVLLGLLVIASLILSACAPAPSGGAPAAEEPAAEAPAAAEQPSSGLGDLPRNETLIADILTGRVGARSVILPPKCSILEKPVALVDLVGVLNRIAPRADLSL